VRVPATLPTVETDRLILRPFDPGDVADIFAYAADPEVARYVPWEAHRSEADSRAFLESVLERVRRGEPDTWAVVERASGRVIGLNRIYAVCNVENAASERVMQKVGMRYEGTLREVSLAKGGYEDRKLHAILRREWLARQGQQGHPGG